MTRHYTYLGLIAAVAMTACSTAQNHSSNITQHSSAGSYSNYQAPSNTQQVNSTYSTSAYQECLKRETNRELIGGAVGGTAGAFVGKELIGGTKGVLAGAALGGAAGYGIGDISTNCGPAPATRSREVYQNSPTSGVTPARYQSVGVTPASYQSVSCPAGTDAQQNGTCLLRASSARAVTSAANTAPTSTYQRYEAASHTKNFVNANALMIPQSLPQVTRQYGASAHQVGFGDTVYSLSRKLCVSVDDIQSANGLDSNYGIQIGQTLQLPPNQC